ncbi:MAG: tripartite tricarboxylate transporter substrate binding protein [Betaproteobacteria bacterium]|nr:tripartite tricarboxylate transporter substrate binding protein [Betaproteobacteria bacterium]
MLSERESLGWSTRRLHAAAVATAIALTSALPCVALAQAGYPDKPIRLVVGLASGGPADTIARVVGQRMGEILGQPMVVDNRPGASGNIANDFVGRLEADGYTLLVLSTINASNETLWKNTQYKVGTHFSAVALLAETNNVLVIHPSLPAKNMAEFVAHAKAKPEKMFYATAGIGSSTHLTHALFDMMAGTKMTAVHYRGGGPALADLLSGQVKIMFASIAPVIGAVREGKLRALSTTGAKRDPAFPDLPTVAEAVLPGFETQLWVGFAVRTGTPRPIVDKLAAAATQAIDTLQVKDRLIKLGFATVSSTPEKFEAFYKSEVAKWAKVIEVTGIPLQE